MVEEQLMTRGIQNPRVLEAMLSVPRHQFLDSESWSIAYGDHPLAIGSEQTISQPYVVAWMSELLSHLPVGSKVLEIGTGCGYQTAILVALGYEVYSVERISKLAGKARETLEKLDSLRVELHIGDGMLGNSQHAPYDAIISTACARRIPKPWIQQIREGGVIITPLKVRLPQHMMRCTKRGRKLVKEDLGLVRFVPLLPGKV